MSNKSYLDEGQKLGGGLVLLPTNAGFSMIFTFGPLQRYSLGEKAFYLESGLVSDALQMLNLRRMEGVSQLQKLTSVSVDDCSKKIRGPHTFGHNRLIHSLRVGALHGIMGKVHEHSCICGICQNKSTLGILAGCGHDMFTCAGGDSWKDINHQGTLFDEDEDFAGKIWRYYGAGWQKLCAKYELDPKSAAQAMQEIVAGRGLAGEVQEIADTASYMLGDLEQVRFTEQFHGPSPEFAEIFRIANQPWDIWNCLKEKDGHLVVTDPIALNNFLLLRVLLWANLYQNPRHKVLEMLMMKVVYPYLVKRKLVKISDLPTKDDAWLFDIVEHKMGWQKDQSKDLNLLGSFPKMETFATWREALVFEEQKYESGDFTLMFSVKEFQKTNSKTDKYLVTDSDGQVGTFKDVFPKHAAVIDKIAADSMSPALPVCVVYVESPTLHKKLRQTWRDLTTSKNLRKAWDEARARWKRKSEK